jgi:hypothetical protein
MEKYHFVLVVNQEVGRVDLCQGKKAVDSVEWVEARKTSEDIFSAMGKLLRGLGLTYQEVPELRLELDLPPHSTARRIAETVQSVYNTFVSYEGS